MTKIIHSDGCAYHLAKPNEHPCNCKPYLFYYEEAEDAWCLCPDRVEHINEQAEDSGLWFQATTASEAYLQQSLRLLTDAVEGLSDV